MKKVDMSEKAIMRRLRTVDRLRELCVALMKIKKKEDPHPVNSRGNETQRHKMP
jgi:hypothetical protein